MKAVTTVGLKSYQERFICGSIHAAVHETFFPMQ